MKTRLQIIESAIFNWVSDNFGNSEAEDPSWNIEALSEAIDAELTVEASYE